MSSNRSPLARLRGMRVSSAEGRDRTELRRLRRVRSWRRGQPGHIRLFGADFEFVDGPSLHAQFKEIFVRGLYDFHVARLAPRILDCGGNIGLASLRFRRLYPQAHIRCYEADPDLAAVARANLLACGDSQTEVIPAAVWSGVEGVRFAPNQEDTGHIDPRGALLVPSCDIANLVAEPVDLLKLDVEGAEAEVLARLVSSGMAGNVRRIACEWHESGKGPSRLHGTLEGLATCGFHYRILHGASSPVIDCDPSSSALAAVPYAGATAMLYAWRSAP